MKTLWIHHIPSWLSCWFLSIYVFLLFFSVFLKVLISQSSPWEAIFAEKRQSRPSLLHRSSKFLQTALLGLLSDHFHCVRDHRLPFALVSNERLSERNSRDLAMGCKRILGSWHSSIFFHSRICQWHIPCSAARHCMELCEILVCFWCIDADSRYRGTGLPRHRRPSWSVASGEIAAIVSLAAHVPNHQTLEGLAGRKHARGCEGGGRDAENRLNRLIAFMITLIWMVFSLQCLSILQKAITLVFMCVLKLVQFFWVWFVWWSLLSIWQGFPSVQNQLAAMRGKFGSLLQPVIAVGLGMALAVLWCNGKCRKLGSHKITISG